MEKNLLNTTKVSSGKALLVSNLNWNNAGRLGLEVTSTGYNGKMNKTIATTGTIYPYKLSLKEIDWNYASGADFSYMGQMFDYRFEVEAQSIGGIATTNYGLFDDNDKSRDLELVAVKKDLSGKNTGENLAGRLLKELATPAAWGKNANSRANSNGAILTESGNLLLSKSIVQTSPLKTKEDGPYDHSNVAFGLKIATIKGGVDFKPAGNNKIIVEGKVAEKFSTQPDIRYGRMRLGNNIAIGSAGSEIKVPVTVEYWNGNQFVINKNDNVSTYRATYYCIDQPTTSISFKNRDGSSLSKKIQSGKSTDLMLVQANRKVEKARLFLRQGTKTPTGTACRTGGYTQPWLQYNWRGLGDEDPSIVASFGQYRGSDRIISRSEK